MKVKIRRSNIKRRRKIGFLARMRSTGGRRAMSRRRFQGRKLMTNV